MKRHGRDRGYSPRCHAVRERAASVQPVASPAPAALEAEPETAPVAIIRISDSILVIAVGGDVVAVAGPG